MVHGRLALSGGNPGFRIWVIGTNRILGVEEAPEEKPCMPRQLQELAASDNLIFADFTVVSVTRDEPGVMRMVRIVSARNIVVTDMQLRLLRRIEAVTVK